jgi:hypothetical protein
MKVNDFRNLIREEIKKVLKEARVPESNEILNDEDLRTQCFKDIDDYIDWLRLFIGQPFQEASQTSKTKHVNIANEFLERNGYKWRVKDILGTNRFGYYVWRIQ